MTTDITVIQNAITGGIRPMVRGPVMLILGLFLAFLMNAKLSLVFLACIPVLGVLFRFFHCAKSRASVRKTARYAWTE